jgi:hypothetical protein
MLPVRATAAALLASWDRAASGWSLQLLIHTDDTGSCFVFIRGNHGGSYGGDPDQWQGQADPWTAYQQNKSDWGSGSQSSWDGNSKGWQNDG